LANNEIGLAPECLIKYSLLPDYDGETVVVGIRPEDYQDAALAPDVPENRRISARVSVLEAFGSEIMAHFRIDAPSVDSGDPDVVEEKIGLDTANAVGRFDPRSRVKLGDTVEIEISTENMHFFDPGTRLAV